MNTTMAQKYLLVPLPIGLFEGYDLLTRAVLGALYGRIRVSNYRFIGDPTGRAFYDDDEQRVYCVYPHAALAQVLGVSERSIRRALERLRDDGLIWWRKAEYGGSCRFFLHERITQELRDQESGQSVTPIRSD